MGASTTAHRTTRMYKELNQTTVKQPSASHTAKPTYNKACPSHSIHQSSPIPIPSHILPSPSTAGINLLGNADNTASGTGASVASLLALLVLALAEVVGAGVDDDGAAEDALRADQLDELVRDGALGVALGVGLEVAQVADVALAVGGGAVGLVVGVDWMKREGMSVMVLLLLGRLVGRATRLDSDSIGQETYSEDRRWCSRWCCHQRCGCACRARRWRRSR